MDQIDSLSSIDIEIIAVDQDYLPLYASESAAGADVKAHISEEIVVEAGASVLVPTGLRVAIPPGYEIQVRPRSGLALKSQVTVLNTPGTIDSDYRGEIGVILINHGTKPFPITPGMRIAQLVVAQTIRAHFLQVELLRSTARGEGGFGHTGTH